ncbi:Thrombospondin-1 [Hondaea fermentalgiana]|uniref:Thrombospondin-1 n=1 Tax=Hondaea fermentalgiana TaxID=2315210 RepID=A0A2R5H1J6_9STRA|nr:Thrombospondin-1 [Hondaea fermentalgiana]|eukprot:GBG34953.1 Thrombospondin-1 [Hondaea fermentalgiana]
MAECSTWNGEACACFAANLGRSCSYCAPSMECMDAADVDENCLQAAAKRREAAVACGSEAQDTNLASEPSQLVSASGVPWSGEEVSVDLGTVFAVEYVSVELAQTTTDQNNLDLRLSVWPSTSENAAAVSRPCTSAGTCTWTLPMPVLQNLTLSSGIEGQSVDLQGLIIRLGAFGPVDGGLGYTDVWSECSTGCGNGTQYRPSHCSSPEPAYGGLPCYAPDSETVIVSGNISRTCYETWACGTDWQVVLIVGWWQALLLFVFVSRKIFQAIRDRRQSALAAAKLRRRRFSSDFDDIGGPIGSDGRVANGDDDDNDDDDNDGDVNGGHSRVPNARETTDPERNYRVQRNVEGEEAGEHLTLA